MRNFYSVLRVAPKANEAAIKSAFRNLAKTCHPDVKPGDKEAEQVFQEVKRAYKFLTNPETRKVYDTFLAKKRASARRRFRRSAATMSATFLLTSVSVFLAMVWLQDGGLPFAGGRELAEGSENASKIEFARAPLPAPNGGQQSSLGQRGPSADPGPEAPADVHLSPESSGAPEARGLPDAASHADGKGLTTLSVAASTGTDVATNERTISEAQPPSPVGQLPQ